MAVRHLCIYDLDNPQDTFADRYPYPLYQYVQAPPRETDPPWTKEYDFSTVPLVDYIYHMEPIQGDILEVMLLNRRFQFQAIQIRVSNPAPGLILTPFTNSGAEFDPVDCSDISDAIYLPFGGKLDSATNLVETAFVLDQPDYIGLKYASNGDITPLTIQITALFSLTFDGLGRNNSGLHLPIGA